MGKSRRVTAVLAAGAAIALALTACSSSAGGGGSSSGSTPAGSTSAPAGTGSASGVASTPASSAAPGASSGAASGSAGSSASGSATGSGSASASAPAGGGAPVSLTIATNGIVGGKNDQEASWITNWVIPNFTKAEAAKGVTVKVNYQASGVDDEKYKAKLALDLKAGHGPDVFAIDGIWVGEFAQAGYIKPLEDVVGDSYQDWDGWSQISDAVKGNASFDGKVYGIPVGTDGRVLFYNKKLFQQAGISEPWQPTSWQDIISTAQTLKQKLPDVTPLQINAGTAMGEATTAQGILPLLAGTGVSLYDNGKWQGNTQQIRDVLNFYNTIYNTDQVGDVNYQLDAKGRDESFADFAKGKIAILAESDYLWRSVIDPKVGIDPIQDKVGTVGYALIPAEKAGSGIRGQDYVSVSGGSIYTLNPNSPNAKLAFDLMTFAQSPDAIKARLAGAAQITERNDVNAEVLANDPMLTFVAQKVLPLTTYRPSLAQYPQVSLALQQATADVVSGTSVDEAAANSQSAQEQIVGMDNEVNN
jgi:multiple sugar transport system substrate-binding protein